MRKPETSLRIASDPEGVCAVEFGDRADAGQEEGGEDGVVDRFDGRLDPLPVGVAAGAVVEGAAGQAVAVGDRDGVDACGVEGGGDAVPDGVHAVPQSDVLDVELGGHRRASAGTVPRAAIASATFPACSGLRPHRPDPEDASEHPSELTGMRLLRRTRPTDTTDRITTMSP